MVSLTGFLKKKVDKKQCKLLLLKKINRNFPKLWDNSLKKGKSRVQTLVLNW